MFVKILHIILITTSSFICIYQVASVIISYNNGVYDIVLQGMPITADTFAAALLNKTPEAFPEYPRRKLLSIPQLMNKSDLEMLNRLSNSSGRYFAPNAFYFASYDAIYFSGHTHEFFGFHAYVVPDNVDLSDNIICIYFHSMRHFSLNNKYCLNGGLYFMIITLLEYNGYKGKCVNYNLVRFESRDHCSDSCYLNSLRRVCKSLFVDYYKSINERRNVELVCDHTFSIKLKCNYFCNYNDCRQLYFDIIRIGSSVYVLKIRVNSMGEAISYQIMSTFLWLLVSVSGIIGFWFGFSFLGIYRYLHYEVIRMIKRRLTRYTTKRNIIKFISYIKLNRIRKPSLVECLNYMICLLFVICAGIQMQETVSNYLKYKFVVDIKVVTRKLEITPEIKIQFPLGHICRRDVHIKCSDFVLYRNISYSERVKLLKPFDRLISHCCLYRTSGECTNCSFLSKPLYSFRGLFAYVTLLSKKTSSLPISHYEIDVMKTSRIFSATFAKDHFISNFVFKLYSTDAFEESDYSLNSLVKHRHANSFYFTRSSIKLLGKPYNELNCYDYHDYHYKSKYTSRGSCISHCVIDQQEKQCDSISASSYIFRDTVKALTNRREDEMCYGSVTRNCGTKCPIECQSHYFLSYRWKHTGTVDGETIIALNVAFPSYDYNYVERPVYDFIDIVNAILGGWVLWVGISLYSLVTTALYMFSGNCRYLVSSGEMFLIGDQIKEIIMDGIENKLKAKNRWRLRRQNIHSLAIIICLMFTFVHYLQLVTVYFLANEEIVKADDGIQNIDEPMQYSIAFNKNDLFNNSENIILKQRNCKFLQMMDMSEQLRITFACHQTKNGTEIELSKSFPSELYIELNSLNFPVNIFSESFPLTRRLRRSLFVTYYRITISNETSDLCFTKSKDGDKSYQNCVNLCDSQISDFKVYSFKVDKCQRKCHYRRCFREKFVVFEWKEIVNNEEKIQIITMPSKNHLSYSYTFQFRYTFIDLVNYCGHIMSVYFGFCVLTLISLLKVTENEKIRLTTKLFIKREIRKQFPVHQ